MKRARRHRRRQKKPPSITYFSGIYPSTGAMICMAADPAEQLRYLQAHRQLPDGLEAWSEERVQQLLDPGPSAREEWERALLLLAHHRSQLANDLLRDLREQVSPELRPFAELAYAESLAWLGYSVVEETPGSTMLVAGGPPGRAQG